MHGAADEVFPNMETFGKQVAIYAQSNTKKYGPKAAEKLLLEIEKDRNEVAPIVVVNRILQAYTDSGEMEKAEDFLKRRLDHLEHSFVDPSLECCYPDRVTLNLLLNGFVKMAKKDADAPQRAKDVADRFITDFGIHPSIQSYSILLNAWSNCARLREDAAQRAEALLRSEVLELYLAGHPDTSPPARRTSRGGLEKDLDFTICVNIVLKAWSFQANHHHQSTKDRAKSQLAVERALGLLAEFLDSSDSTIEANDSMKRLDAPRTDLARTRSLKCRLSR
ncbi:MAG: hypothetical protein SGARI_005310 [Bacillariaceae sp.]